MAPLKHLYLIDQRPELVEAWEQVFQNTPQVEVNQADFFSKPADAMLSPANSFGIMDGGLDLAIHDVLGMPVEKRVQEAIMAQYHGELPVGCSLIVPTGHEQWRYLVVAPTMRIPEPVQHRLNPYLAFRRALLAIQQHNQGNSDQIDSLLCPGLGTGIGQVRPRRCAGHMFAAWKQLSRPARIASYGTIHQVHRALQLAD